MMSIRRTLFTTSKRYTSSLQSTFNLLDTEVVNTLSNDLSELHTNLTTLEGTSTTNNLKDNNYSKDQINNIIIPNEVASLCARCGKAPIRYCGSFPFTCNNEE